MPAEGVRRIPHREILRFEEIERVVRAAVDSGVRKVRITGGEPLVRQGICQLVERIARIEGLVDLPMTTNGVLLEKFAADLKKAGLKRITVSLDTLRPERYARITGKPALDSVLAGIEEAISRGLVPLKINVVAVPGENDDEVMDFVGLAREKDIEVRFIEQMPLLDRSQSPHCGLPAGEGMAFAELKGLIERETGPLRPIAPASGSGPAQSFELPGSKGKVGFIAPLTQPFCTDCGRMRLTPDGRLRACLALENELDVKGPLRAGIDDRGLRELFARAVEMKPDQAAACFSPRGRSMSQIGG